MSVTLVGRPKGGDELNPCYNPVVYYFDSTNKTEPGFRYIAQIKNEAGGLLFEKTLLPSPDGGLCDLHLNRDLQDYLSWDIVLADTSPERAINSYLRFNIEIGEEYNTEWLFDSLIYLDENTTYWPNANNPQYNPPNPFLNKQALTTTSLGVVPPFAPGDSIFVTLDDPSILPATAGFHKVLDVFNANSTDPFYWTIVLDLTYQGNGTTSGSVKYADNRKTRFLNELAVEDQVVFNGVLSPQDWLDWNEDDYSMSTTDMGKWLTICPNPYKVRVDNTVFLNAFKKLATLNTSGPAKWLIENDTGDSATISSFVLNDAIRQLDVSPTRTTWGSITTGTFPIIKPTTKWYEVTALDSANAPVSVAHRFLIDRSCTTEYEDIEMIFLDKLGSIIPFNFTLRNVESRKINKQNLTTYLGGRVDDTVDYFSYDLKKGGKITYDESFVRNYLLRTDFLNDEYAKFFVELIESPVTMIKIDGEFHRCIITTSNYEVKKERWYELKRYEINVELSNRNKINI